MLRWLWSMIELLHLAEENDVVCEGCIAKAEVECCGCGKALCERCSVLQLHEGKCAQCSGVATVTCLSCNRRCHPENTQCCLAAELAHRHCSLCLAKRIIEGSCGCMQAETRLTLH